MTPEQRNQHVAMVLRGARAAAERRVALREKAMRTRRAWGGIKSQAIISARKALGAKARSPDDALAERDALYAAPRTITADVFGDPLPGRSALDRRRP